MAKEVKYDKMPESQDVIEIIKKFNITGADRNALIYIIDALYANPKVKDVILVQTDNASFKTLQNSAQEINRLRAELSKIKESRIYKLLVKFKIL
jgi:hypothetical protein